MMSQPRDEALPSFVHLIIMFGIIWAVIGFELLPLVMVMAYRRGWFFLVNVAWLILPIITLLTSLRYWFTARRAGAVADAIVSCGVAFVWLLMIVTDIVGQELGLLPYVVITALLIFTVLSFWAFTHSVSEDAPVIRSMLLSRIYWAIFAATIIIIGITYGLVFHFQIMAE